MRHRDHLLLPRRAGDPVVLRVADGAPDHSPTTGAEDLAVFVGSADSYQEGRLPMAGTFERTGDLLSFTPTFGFTAGQDYVVRARHDAHPHRLSAFTVPCETAPADAHVTAVYPSGSVIPENTLRFYIHFSVPMAPHRAFDFVRLRNAAGVADDAAFMRFKQELWNDDRTRLTVLLDPGRIKRGVATNLDVGPALLEGQRSALTVDDGWPSADGSSTLASHTKNFSVSRAMREQPATSLWTWRPPRSGTREPLRIVFDRPFDRHLLAHCLNVTSKNGQTIEGIPHIGDNESSWHFTPHDSWPPDDVRVTVDDVLEDVAGNNFHELLDHRAHRAHPRHPSTASVPIRPRP